MNITRRVFIKNSVIAATATIAGVTISGIALANTSKDEVRWDKIPCRFCGIGCSVQGLFSFKNYVR